jgi:catechol 2,3-dioxygenase-like lactoylglutathione lyase family enzyme
MFKGSIVPVLRIFDLTKALEFYVGFLGFEEEFRHQFEPETPSYLGLVQDGVRLHLSEHFGDASPGTHVRIEVTDVAALCVTLNEKRYRHSRPGFQDQEWGNREMTISDPFGNRATFWQSLKSLQG